MNGASEPGPRQEPTTGTGAVRNFMSRQSTLIFCRLSTCTRIPHKNQRAI